MSQQGIVGRVMQLARANVNAMIDSAEDPQVMLDQLVRDYSAHILRGRAGDRADDRELPHHRSRKTSRKRPRPAQQWGKKGAGRQQEGGRVCGATGTVREADTFDDLARVASWNGR